MRFKVSNLKNGYTLVELLVVMGLITIVTGVLVTVIYQFYTVTSLGNAQLAVDADLRNAGLWLMRDGNQSTVFTQTGTCGVFAAPTFIGSTRYITYTFSAGTLSRQDSGTGQVIGVARRVTGVQCQQNGRSVSITLTSANGNVSNSAMFTVALRVD